MDAIFTLADKDSCETSSLLIVKINQKSLYVGPELSWADQSKGLNNIMNLLESTCGKFTALHCLRSAFSDPQISLPVPSIFLNHRICLSPKYEVGGGTSLNFLLGFGRSKQPLLCTSTGMNSLSEKEQWLRQPAVRGGFHETCKEHLQPAWT